MPDEIDLLCDLVAAVEAFDRHFDFSEPFDCPRCAPVERERADLAEAQHQVKEALAAYRKWRTNDA